jgi:hypothetical protein
MSALTALLTLAAGQRPAGALLPPVRLHAGGAELFGEEAVVHAFRRAPIAFSDAADILEADGHVVICEGENALFASTYGELIARIWRIGPGEPGAVEPSLGVPFDTDLRQSRVDVGFRAEDRPALSADAASVVATIGADLAHGWTEGQGEGAYRTRPFLIRAFSNGADGAALFAIYRLGPDAVRTSGFAYAAARFRIENGQLVSCRIVRDLAGEAAVAAAQWRARVD